MEVANDKIVAPSLFDLVAPARATSDGPSFRDCLQVCPTAPPRPSEPSSRQAEASKQPQERTRSADPPRPAPASRESPQTETWPKSEGRPASDLDESAGPSAADEEQQEELSPEEVLAVEAAVAVVKPAVLPDAVDLSIVVDGKVVVAGESSPEEGGNNATAKLHFVAESAAEDLIASPMAATAVEEAGIASAEATGAELATDAALLAGLEKQPADQAQAHRHHASVVAGREKAVRRLREQAAGNEGAEESVTAEKGVVGTDPVQDSGLLVPSEQVDQIESTSRNEPTEAKKSATLEAPLPTIDKETTNPSSSSDALSGGGPTAAEPAGSSNSREATSPPVAGSDAIAGNTSAARPPAALLKAKSGDVGPASRPGEIDPAKFLHRVAKAFESAQQRDSEVRLRLHPAELGSLSVQIHVQEGVLSARLQVETSEARTALVENLPALRERLAEQGIRIEQFDVDLQDHSQRQQQSLREQFQEHQAQRELGPRAAKARAATSRESLTAPDRTPGPGGLNVVI